MSASLLLVHGDDSFEVDRTLAAFATRIDASDRVEIVAERSPDEDAIGRAGLEAASVGLFGARLAVLRQPVRAAGRSTAAADRLLRLVAELPDGSALALADLRPSRDATRPPAFIGRLEDAVRRAGGDVVVHLAPRRGELQGWIRRRAGELGVDIAPRAAALLAERVGGAVAETDIERGEQTRVADGELRKLATYAAGRAVEPDDVEQLVADTRPASLYAITNALDRRDPAAAGRALQQALDEGQPVLRIMAALSGRVSDLIVARDLVASGARPQELTLQVGRGNARVAERIAEAARRYSDAELESMLRGLFEADLAIKTNAMEPEPAVSAWLGTYLMGVERSPRP
jgi:DNA polymerase III delta subunit